MADIRVRVGQPDLHVNVGQQDAIKVLASSTAVTSGISTFAVEAGIANTALYAYNSAFAALSLSVNGGTASVTQLDVSGISSFSGEVYFNGNIIGNLSSIDGGLF
jgi:hypothetical protein